MNSRTIKALNSIFVQGNFSRLWQVVNKSPLVYIMTYLRRLIFLPVYFRRKKASLDISLSDTQLQIFKNLQTNGFANVDHLFTEEDYIGLDKYLSEKIEKAEQARNNQKVKTKDFWLRLSDSDDEGTLSTSHPMVAISLKNQLLQVVASYLKTAPFLQYTLMTYSYPMEGGPQSSQLWHHDFDGEKILKFFIYLSDVEKDEDGPFTLIPAYDSAKVHNSFFPKHLSDDEISKYIDLGATVKIKGKKWSAFVCDTHRCYHMGSRVSDGHYRIMMTSLYLSLPSPYPGATNRKIKIDSELNSLQKKAIEV
jgi:hypothetical protein